jgi:hypothetical protein
MTNAARFPKAAVWLVAAGLLSACACVACGGDDNGTTGKYEMYINEEALNVNEITFLKGRCCGRMSISDKSPDARAEVIRAAEALADAIPIDGSKPTSDTELIELVPAPGTGDMSDWNEDLDVDPEQGPRVITTNAFDWGNGGVGPFEDNGFEAVAVETYVHAGQGWKMALDLLYMSSPEGADAAFHYRSPDYPDEPYWDMGTQLH